MKIDEEVSKYIEDAKAQAEYEATRKKSTTNQPTTDGK